MDRSRYDRVRPASTNTFCVLLLCCFFACSIASAHILIPLAGGGEKGAQHKEIETLERQWQTALLAGDNATLAALLSDTYVGIGPDGTIASKSEELQARATGQQRLEKLETDDRKIRIYGTTAVVTSKAQVKGVYFGQPLLGEYRYTRVWSYSHGQWHIVSFEANRVHDLSERKH